MSVAAPADMHGHEKHAGAGEGAVLSIEQLRAQLHSCFSCGVSWRQQHVSLDCGECGGYSLQRPCPRCDGRCDALWTRDLALSHACGKARWQGRCALALAPAPQAPPQAPPAARPLCSGSS